MILDVMVGLVLADVVAAIVLASVVHVVGRRSKHPVPLPSTLFLMIALIFPAVVLCGIVYGVYWLVGF